MKLHPIFGINALARVCICCGKVIGYTRLEILLKKMLVRVNK